MLSAVTISLVSEARGGPFVFWDDLAAGCAKAAGHGFAAVEVFPASADALDAGQLKQLLAKHNLKLAAMVSLIEPMMLIFMGMLVAFILISLYLPIFSLSTTGMSN